MCLVPAIPIFLPIIFELMALDCASRCPLWLFHWLDLGANPVESLLRQSGGWGLRFLFVTLAISPCRQFFQWAWVIKYRRMMGVFSFFYISVHFLLFGFLDLAWALSDLKVALLERPFILLGFTAYLLLIPLAITSTQGMMKKLGKRWKSLHQLVYIVGLLAVSHYFWLVKKDITEPLIYAGLLVVFLAFRVKKWWPKLR